jgi:pseudoazurin
MKLIFSALLLMFVSSQVMSADITIEMLNKQGKERMVFSEKIVEIDVGDTILWKAKSRGHNVEFIKKRGVPEGVSKFKSRISKDTQYTFKTPGIYAYWCTPHKGLGMIGFVVVGKNTNNMDDIKKIKYGGKSKKIFMELLPILEKIATN